MIKDRDSNIKIIIKTPKFIGDTIMMLSALSLLQDYYKNATFTIVSNPNFKDIFREIKIEKFIADNSSTKNGISSYLTTIKKLRYDKYDLGVLFHNSISSAILFKLAKIETIIGYNNDYRGILLNFSPKIDRTRHYINHYLYLVNTFLDNYYTKFSYTKLKTKKQELFKKNEKTTIAFVLGSDKGYRGYPKDLSIELFKLLAKKDYHLILLGDKQDQKTNKIYANIASNSIDLSAKTTLAEFIDIIADVDLLVTIDTSAMHITAAVETDFIALLGKGTSPFSLVKPKVNFGTYLQKEEFFINDEENIKLITPKLIVETIKKRVAID